MADRKKRTLNRRDFLMRASASVISAPLALSRQKAAFGQDKKSRIVVVKAPGVVEDRKPVFDRVVKMVGAGVCKFTGKADPADAWREVVSPEDVVGIKVNPIGGVLLSTKRELVDAIVVGLKASGVKEENIIIWDRFEDHLIKRAGYTFNNSGRGVQCYATEGPNGAGYDDEVFYESEQDTPRDRDEPGTKSFLSKILTQQITALINVPVLKDHNASGITACLKNIAFGSINNTRRFHRPPFYCDPAIPDVCALPVVRQKLRLNIVDALEACFDRGPTSMNIATKWNEEAIYLGTDMVALDATCLRLVNEKRKERRVRPIGPKAKHVQTAAAESLGTDDPSQIEVETVNV